MQTGKDFVLGSAYHNMCSFSVFSNDVCKFLAKDIAIKVVSFYKCLFSDVAPFSFLHLCFLSSVAMVLLTWRKNLKRMSLTALSTSYRWPCKLATLLSTTR